MWINGLAIQGSYSNKNKKFQYIPRWLEVHFQDISDEVHKCSDQYARKAVEHLIHIRNKINVNHN